MLTPTLTVADSQNGTGAVATITGSDPGNPTNTVQVQSVADAAAWAAQGSVTGNGALNLSLQPGYYWAAAVSQLGGVQVVSNLVRFVVSTASDSVHKRIIDATAAGIQGLLMGRLPARQVYPKLVPDQVNVTFPCVFLTPEDAEQFKGGTNYRDDIEYPVVVYIVDRNDKDYTRPLGEYLKWREQIMDWFRFQHLAGVTEVYTCNVRPSRVIDPKTPLYMHIVSSFTLGFVARVRRGVK